MITAMEHQQPPQALQSGLGRKRTHKDSGGACVLEGTGSSHLVQSDLGLHTCHSLSIVIDGAVPTRNGEHKLWTLQKRAAFRCTYLLIDCLVGDRPTQVGPTYCQHSQTAKL